MLAALQTFLSHFQFVRLHILDTSCHPTQQSRVHILLEFVILSTLQWIQ